MKGWQIAAITVGVFVAVVLVVLVIILVMKYKAAKATNVAAESSLAKIP